jgi:hypothetical protein
MTARDRTPKERCLDSLRLVGLGFAGKNFNEIAVNCTVIIDHEDSEVLFSGRCPHWRQRRVRGAVPK